jgi:hypothetical protein
MKTTEKKIDESLNERPVVSMGLNIAIIMGTILFPVIGVAMGYTYYRKDHPSAKKAGRNWLILGIVMFLVHIMLVNSMK